MMISFNLWLGGDCRIDLICTGFSEGKSMTLQPLTSESATPDGMRTAAPNFLPEIDYPDSDGNPMSDNVPTKKVNGQIVLLSV